MRKLILILALALCCTVSHAQWYVGGGIGLGRSYSGRGVSLNIHPDLAYRFNNVFTAGAQLSYRTGYPGVGVTPYARAHVFGAKNLSLFVTAGVPCVFDDDYSSVGFVISPGAALKVSKRVYLMAHLGRVGYYSVTSGGVRSTGWNSGFTRDDVNVGFIFAI